MEEPLGPILLLADSQVLFWQAADGPYMRRFSDLLAARFPGEPIRAAYIGASNGDAPEFYDLFVGAMGAIGIDDTRLIPSVPSSQDLDYLDAAHLVLLAGGDTRRGWTVLEEQGMSQRLIARYYGGALLIGVSAGAIQLGLKGWGADDGPDDLFDTLRLIPFVIDAHDQPQWTRLRAVVRAGGPAVRGVGIPAGGGALFYPDWSIEPIRNPLVEYTCDDTGVRQALLFPPETDFQGGDETLRD